jgi:hypothetical protein
MKERTDESRRARVFISCGQAKDSDELDTAHKIRGRLEEQGFEPYIAVEEQSLRGLKENIFPQLQNSEYFVFVDFKREQLVRRYKTGNQPRNQEHRGSLFSHQELALASFLDLELIAFQEKGVKRDDGILRFLQANAIPFTDRNLLPNVIADEVTRRKWNPHSRNELVLEACDEPRDATVHGTLESRRFFYVQVKNLHSHKTATNCYAYLEKAIWLGHPSVEIPFESVELKWAGYTLPNANILPHQKRRFDAFYVAHHVPARVGFVVFSDAPSMFGHPAIDKAGKYEMQYAVVSDNFPIARESFLLSLSDARNTKLEVGTHYTQDPG